MATDWKTLPDGERQSDRDWFTQNSVGADDDLGVSDMDDDAVTDTLMARYEHEQRVEWNRVTFGSFDDDERVPWYEGPIPAWAKYVKEDPLFEQDREQEWWDDLTAAGTAVVDTEAPEPEYSKAEIDSYVKQSEYRKTGFRFEGAAGHIR